MDKIDIIMTYFTTDYLIKQSIPRLLQTQGFPFNIYIVDNTLKSRGMLTRKFVDNRIHIINGVQQRPGYERGRQHPRGIEVGLANTTSPYIALFHCDSWPIAEDWAIQCFSKLNLPNVELVGIQHESSLHHSFHFLRRSTLAKYNYHYDIEKRQFNDSVYRLVKHPEVFIPRRHKWDWGEDLATKILENNSYTVGLRPTMACYPKEHRNELLYSWSDFKDKGLGIVYGNMVFHNWKSYRRKEQVKTHLDFYNSGRYLKEYYFSDNATDIFVLNKGKHNNESYLDRVDKCSYV